MRKGLLRRDALIPAFQGEVEVGETLAIKDGGRDDLVLGEVEFLQVEVTVAEGTRELPVLIAVTVHDRDVCHERAWGEGEQGLQLELVRKIATQSFINGDNTTYVPLSNAPVFLTKTYGIKQVIVIVGIYTYNDNNRRYIY